MNIEDIKEGETYNVRVKVLCKGESVIGCCTVDKKNNKLMEFMTGESPAFSPISTETAPKYDPNRTFRKGDIVSPDLWQGRKPWCKGKDGSYHANPLWKCIVVEDEWNGYVKCKKESGWEFLICACFLKLKVAIEQAKPFYVERDDNDGCYFVMRDDGCDRNVDTIVQAFYFQSDDYNAHYFTQERAKELADEVCSKMNEEYRKKFV